MKTNACGQGAFLGLQRAAFLFLSWHLYPQTQGPGRELLSDAFFCSEIQCGDKKSPPGDGDYEAFPHPYSELDLWPRRRWISAL